ncbi:MAG: flagellar biosynthetic protein FliR [Planctomycetota bacterium]
MPSLDFILPHALPVMLVVARLIGLFLFAPILNSSTIPRMYRVLLALMFGLAIYPFTPPIDPAVSLAASELVPMLFAELVIGLAIGLVASLPLLAVQMGGYIMGYLLGLSLAESFNPVLESNGSVVGDLLFYLAIFAFIGIGGPDVLFVTMAESFRTVPLGTFTSGDVPLEMFVTVLGSGFELAIRIATPVMGVVSMLMLSMGFIMKTMPEVNIMSIGFAAQIVCGLIMLFAGITVVANVATEEVYDVLDTIIVWVRSFADPDMGGDPTARPFSAVRETPYG